MVDAPQSHLGKHAHQPAELRSRGRPAVHMQNKLEEGEKSGRLSLSLMQTVCLAPSGIARPAAKLDI